MTLHFFYVTMTSKNDVRTLLSGRGVIWRHQGNYITTYSCIGYVYIANTPPKGVLEFPKPYLNAIAMKRRSDHCTGFTHELIVFTAVFTTHFVTTVCTISIPVAPKKFDWVLFIYNIKGMIYCPSYSIWSLNLGLLCKYQWRIFYLRNLYE